MKEKYYILIRVPLRFVPKGPIDDKSALVQVKSGHLFDAKPFPEPMLTQFTDAYMRRQEMSLRQHSNYLTLTQSFSDN